MDLWQRALLGMVIVAASAPAFAQTPASPASTIQAQAVPSSADRAAVPANVVDYGAHGDAKRGQFAATLSGTALRVTAGRFAPTDVDATIVIPGAGTAGGTFVTRIAGYISADAVTLATPAPNAVSGVATIITWGKYDDTKAIQSAIDKAGAGGGTVEFPPGVYLISAPITVQPSVKLPASFAGAMLHFSPKSIINVSSNGAGVIVATAPMTEMFRWQFNASLRDIAPYYSRMSGLVLDGSGLAKTGVLSNYSMHMEFAEDAIYNVTTGLQIIGYGGARIEQNVILAATDIQLGGSGASPGGGDTAIVHNDLYPTNGSGIAIGIDVGPWGGNTSIMGNTMSRVTTGGVGTAIGVRWSGDEDTAGSGSHEIRNVVVDANEFSGFDYGVYGVGFGSQKRNVWNNEIVHNHITANAPNGTKAQATLASLTHVDDTLIRDNWANGIHIAAAAGPVIVLNDTQRTLISGNDAGGYIGPFLQNASDTDTWLHGNVDGTRGNATYGVGGNAIGRDAVDLQAFRTAGAQVASGAFAAILGGRQNSASNTAAVAAGQYNTAGGYASVSMGGGNQVTGTVSSAPGGYGGTDRGRYGCLLWASGQIAAAGDAESCTSVFHGTGSSNAAITPTADGAAIGDTNCMPIPDNTAYAITVDVVALDHTSSGNNESWNNWTGLLTRRSGVGSTTLKMNTTPAPLTNGTVAGSSITISANTRYGCPQISFTPPTGNTGKWNVVARVRTVEVQ